MGTFPGGFTLPVALWLGGGTLSKLGVAGGFNSPLQLAPVTHLLFIDDLKVYELSQRIEVHTGGGGGAWCSRDDPGGGGGGGSVQWLTSGMGG